MIWTLANTKGPARAMHVWHGMARHAVRRSSRLGSSTTRPLDGHYFTPAAAELSLIREGAMKVTRFSRNEI